MEALILFSLPLFFFYDKMQEKETRCWVFGWKIDEGRSWYRKTRRVRSLNESNSCIFACKIWIRALNTMTQTLREESGKKRATNGKQWNRQRSKSFPDIAAFVSRRNFPEKSNDPVPSILVSFKLPNPLFRNSNSSCSSTCCFPYFLCPYLRVASSIFSSREWKILSGPCCLPASGFACQLNSLLVHYMLWQNVV